MKKTRRKNILRSVFGSLNRFLSILFIVALGAGFMAGLAATSPDMYDTADSYMDEYRWYDVDIKSTLGFSDSDIDALSRLGISDAMQPAAVMDMVLAKEDVSYTARVFGILDDEAQTDINRFCLMEGRLPQDASECVIQSTSGGYSEKMPALGEVLTLSPDNADYDALQGMVDRTYMTVVGIAESPMCISVEPDSTNVGSGSIGLDVFIMEDFFTLDYPTDIFITVSGAAELNTFSDEYDEKIDGAVRSIEGIEDERTELRSEEFRSEIEKAVTFLRDAAALAESIADVQISLAADGAMRAALNASITETISASDPAFAGMLGEVSENAAARFKNEEYSEPPFLTDLRSGLGEAEAAIEDFEDAFWIIRTRDDSAGYSNYDGNVSKVAALAKIFPVFFFVVALLVALTTMTRLIEENRTQIGTLKALGFSNGQIVAEYMAYSLCAAVLGCALGFAVGFRIFPWAISSAYGMMYFLPETKTPFRLNIVAWVAPVTIVSILLATLWACFDEFRSCPASLMLPKAPAAGKRVLLERITPIWKRLSFNYKVTFRNLFRYKKRLFMTVIGVAGCSALLLTGFGLRDSITDIVDKQFGEIYRYELTMVCDEADAAENDATLRSFLEDSDSVESYCRCAQETGRVSFEGEAQSVSLIVPKSGDPFAECLALRDRKKGTPIAFPETGVVLTEKLCEELGIKAGDTVTLENEDGRKKAVSVEAITENYIAAYAYLSEETYLELFGSQPDISFIFCCIPEGTDGNEAAAEALESHHVLYSRSSMSLKDTFAESIKSIDGVIAVLILAAGLLSIVVLYNLNNVNICERRKELATLRVLGFYTHEIEQYIFRESNILSFFGSLVGLGIGVWLHSFVVRTVEVNSVMFGRNIYPLSFLYSIVISVVFTLIVNLIMKRTIGKIDMVEAMKSND